MKDPIVGKKIDGYRIREVLGRGGMGVVYKAEDVALSRTVAIKRINPDLARDETFLQRFRSEARALARIDSSYIVTVHALRQTDVGLFIVMECVDGGTVKDLIQEGPLSWQRALPIIKQMLEALKHAHRAGVIHRDIKPHNIMLTANETVKVTDFGLARVHRTGSQRTVTQGIYGTLDYMSPEQVQGRSDLDHRSDLYSLGMTIYEMLAGDLPFKDDSSEFTKMRMIVEDDLPRPDQFRPRIPEELSKLIAKALEKNPEDRFQSAGDMRKALETFEAKHGGLSSHTASPVGGASSSHLAGKRSWILGGALTAVISLVGVGGYLLANFGSEGATREGAETSARAPKETQLSISTDPMGANVLRDGESLGATPMKLTEGGEAVTLRFQKPGYAPVDTTLRLTGAPRSLQISLVEERPRRPEVAQAQPPTNAPAQSRSPSGNGNSESPDQTEMESSTSSSSPQGSLTLTSFPQETQVYINGERKETGSAVQLPVGKHNVRFEHPQYGSKDTTLTVVEGQEDELTCYFTHEVTVQSDPWANVLINGTNTEQTTPHSINLRAGTTYEIGVRIRREGYEVTGGVYRQRVEERYIEKGSFSGSVHTIELKPAFESQTHILRFLIEESSL